MATLFGKSENRELNSNLSMNHDSECSKVADRVLALSKKVVSDSLGFEKVLLTAERATHHWSQVTRIERSMDA
jgi:hypothetical protein